VDRFNVGINIISLQAFELEGSWGQAITIDGPSLQCNWLASALSRQC